MTTCLHNTNLKGDNINIIPISNTIPVFTWSHHLFLEAYSQVNHY